MMKRTLVLALATLTSSACTTREIRPESEPILDAYQACWDARDLTCTQRLFTPKAWEKAGPRHSQLYSNLNDGNFHWTLSYKTNREFGKSIIVAAYRGLGTTPTGAVKLDGIAGFYLNRDGVVSKFTPDLRSGGPERYAARWPKVQRSINTLGIANGADFATTGACLLKYPAAREANLLLAPIFKVTGPVAGPLLLGIGGYYYGRYNLEASYWAGFEVSNFNAYGPSVMHAGAALWNASLCF